MNTTLPPENIYTPNQTLYINNLNEKIKPEETKVSLYFLCSQYGEILEIITKKSDKMRGQAFVVFKDLTAATNAMRALQGFVFFDHPLRINYAKEKSDVVAKLEGTYVTKPKGVTKEKAEVPTKKVKTDQTERRDRTQQQQPQRAPKQKDVGAPNNILFVENLPENCTDEALTPLFKQFPGLKDVRVIGSKQVAFIEYGDEIQAGMAMSGLNGFYLTKENALVISYAKQ